MKTWLIIIFLFIADTSFGQIDTTTLYRPFIYLPFDGLLLPSKAITLRDSLFSDKVSTWDSAHVNKYAYSLAAPLADSVINSVFGTHIAGSRVIQGNLRYREMIQGISMRNKGDSVLRRNAALYNLCWNFREYNILVPYFDSAMNDTGYLFFKLAYPIEERFNQTKSRFKFELDLSSFRHPVGKRIFYLVCYDFQYRVAKETETAYLKVCPPKEGTSGNRGSLPAGLYDFINTSIQQQLDRTLASVKSCCGFIEP